jgi:N-dimethylarginine dimethylaminohydrolase
MTTIASDTFLMCAPEHFEVAYIINPWMEGNVAHGRNWYMPCVV